MICTSNTFLFRELLYYLSYITISILRDLNPHRNLGRVACCHYTKDAFHMADRDGLEPSSLLLQRETCCQLHHRSIKLVGKMGVEPILQYFSSSFQTKSSTIIFYFPLKYYFYIVVGEGFEPSKVLNQLGYSQPPLAIREPYY